MGILSKNIDKVNSITIIFIFEFDNSISNIGIIQVINVKIISISPKGKF